MDMSKKTKISLEVFSDVVCPWCYIGWRRLESAVRQHQGVELDMRWRAFLLNPNMPPEGMERQAYIQAKFGQVGTSFYDRIAVVGRESGIAFDFGAITRTPDSRRIHQLIQGAGAAAHDVKLTLFADYFEHGVDISAPDYLNALSSRFGIAPSAIDAPKASLKMISIRGRCWGFRAFPISSLTKIGRYLARKHPRVSSRYLMPSLPASTSNSSTIARAAAARPDCGKVWRRTNFCAPVTCISPALALMKAISFSACGN